MGEASDPYIRLLQVADFVARTAAVIGGRTLVLTTTLRALQAISAALQRHFKDSKALEILVQGQQPKRELLERFRLGEHDGGAGCILVASASFWEGVDVPGDALQLVVIDKLPFPPPNDPLVEARTKRLEAAGRSVFNSYFIPEAALALKQGAGRLIRRESDQGVLVVCDTRLVLMGYGRRLLAALPPMRKINSEDELIKVLNALTKPSTTDPIWL
jgi:ATP-dependent DNA helicase DinG